MSGAAGFVALIPARLASTRLPDKPLADIGGAPMVVRVAERAARSGARLVAVATDSPRIADAVRAAGHLAVMTDASHPSGTDRLAQAARALSLTDDEIVVNVQGDEPLIPPELIAAVARQLAAAPDCAMATAAHPVRDAGEYLDPNAVKLVADAAGRALYFSRAPIPFDRDHPPREGAPLSEQMSSSGLPLRHVGIYAYRNAFLQAYPSLPRSPLETLESLEQLRALWHGHRIAVLVTPEGPPPGVDTPADLERARAAFAASQAGAGR